MRGGREDGVQLGEMSSRPNQPNLNARGKSFLALRSILISIKLDTTLPSLLKENLNIYLFLCLHHRRTKIMPIKIALMQQHNH